MLNIINGIIFIPSKEEDIEKLREELTDKQQQISKQLQEKEQNNNILTQSNHELKINAQDDDLQ